MFIDVEPLKTKSGICKLVEIVLLILCISLYYSIHSIGWGGYSDWRTSQFATAIIVSAFLQTISLVLIYLLGASDGIKKTIYEPIITGFYCAMMLCVGISIFATSYLDAGAICTALFSLGASFVLGVDTYFAVIALNSAA